LCNLASVLLLSAAPCREPLTLPAMSPPSIDRPFFSFHATAPTPIYTLSLHDALPIYARGVSGDVDLRAPRFAHSCLNRLQLQARSEEHTSELQSRFDLVCRLLLEKKKPSSNATRTST